MENDPKPVDPYEVVLADLRAQRDRIDQAIAAILAVRGVIAGASTPTAQPPSPVQKGADATKPALILDANVFVGMTISDAVKELLSTTRRPLTNTEILDGLQKGGLLLNSSEPINVVGSTLVRRFKDVGDIVRVSRGVWGLKDWYPDQTFSPGRRLKGTQDNQLGLEAPALASSQASDNSEVKDAPSDAFVAQDEHLDNVT